MKEKFEKIVNIRNKKAGYEYQLLDTYVAGIALTGTEIKSIREQKVNFQDSYCTFNNDELFVRELNISPFTHGTHYNHTPKRERKLLLKRQELKKLQSKSEEKGLTILPVRIFINDRGLAKLEIALAKGKKLHDKREDIKDRDIKREIQKERY